MPAPGWCGSRNTFAPSKHPALRGNDERFPQPRDRRLSMLFPAPEDRDPRSNQVAPRFGGSAQGTNGCFNPNAGCNRPAFDIYHRNQEAAKHAKASHAAFSRAGEFPSYDMNTLRQFPSKDRDRSQTAQDPVYDKSVNRPHAFGGPSRTFTPPSAHSPRILQNLDNPNSNHVPWLNNFQESQSNHHSLVPVESSEKHISFDLSHDRLMPSDQKFQYPRSILKSKSISNYTQGPNYDPHTQFMGSSLFTSGSAQFGPRGATSSWANDYTFHNTIGCNSASSLDRTSFSGQGNTQAWSLAPPNTANDSRQGSRQNNDDPSFKRALLAFQGSWKLFIDKPPPEYMKELLAQAEAHNINVQRFIENGEINEKDLAHFIYDSAPTCQVLLSGMSRNVSPDEFTGTIFEGALQSIRFEPLMNWCTEGELEVEVTFKTRDAAERFVQRGRAKQIVVRGEPVRCEWSTKRISEVRRWEKDQTRILQVRGPDTHEFCVPKSMEGYLREKDQCDTLSSPPRWLRHCGKGYIQFEYATIRKCRDAMSCLRERFFQLGCQNDFDVRFGPDPCDQA